MELLTLFTTFDTLASFLIVQLVIFMGKLLQVEKLPSVPFVPSAIIQNIMVIILLVEISSLYFIFMKGARKWHGAEHKLIASLENDDVDNAKSYSPIHERCGGTLIPTIIFANAVWILFVSYTGIIFGYMTFIGLFMVANIKVFHKYDKFGIWFGKLFQKYFTVREPDDWQLNMGKVAAINLLLAEQGKDYERGGLLRK